MAIAFYMDVHIPRTVTMGLRLRGVDVLPAQEDNCAQLSDPELLERATELRRVLFTFDDDLLREAAYRQKTGLFFTGVIYTHLLQMSIGPCIHDLETIAKESEPEDLFNQVKFLPL